MEEAKEKLFIIPVFIPYKGCPHRCIFCNQTTITGQNSEELTPDFLRKNIEAFLRFKPDKRKTQISFYGGTFLGMPAELITMSLKGATEYIDRGVVDSIRFSTRPDTITPKNLTLLKPYPVETVELGVQSMDDNVLFRSDRGHTAADTLMAHSRLRESGFETGIQLMPGLPGDTEKTIFNTLEKVLMLRPDFVRIYPTIVFKGSGLEKLVREDNFSPLGLEKSIEITKNMYLRFLKAGIPVIRMGLQSSVDFEREREIIDGPYHPAFGHLVLSAVFLDMAFKGLEKTERDEKKITIYVNNKDISKMRGLKNSNIDVLSDFFKPEIIKVKTDNSLKINSIRINDMIIDMMSISEKRKGGRHENN